MPDPIPIFRYSSVFLLIGRLLNFEIKEKALPRREANCSLNCSFYAYLSKKTSKKDGD
jgi:hypothetical protein